MLTVSKAMCGCENKALVDNSTPTVSDRTIEIWSVDSHTSEEKSRRRISSIYYSCSFAVRNLFVIKLKR